MTRWIGAVLLVATAAGGAAAYWLYRTGRLPWPARQEAALPPVDEENWLEHLGSQNPRLAEEAEHKVTQLGPAALPIIKRTLRDPVAEAHKKKSALRACAVIGAASSPALEEAGAALLVPDLAAEAAVALSVMGPEAVGPLRVALANSDAVVRKEALRSFGKLRYRGPLDATEVVPPLLEGLADPDPGVRSVAATYLGIIHELPEASVPALIETLHDENGEVRTAAASALGAFGPAAESAVPALRKAAGDRDENVAREAGLALVKLKK